MQLRPKHLLTIIVAISCHFVFSCKKSVNTKGSTTTISKYNFICWNKTAGEITNFSIVGNGVIHQLWNFGDGTTDTLGGNPIDHIYRAPGIYTVTLIINGDTAHPVTQVDTIAPNFWFYNTGTPLVGDTIFFHYRAYLPLGINYLWTFGDGSSSTDSIPYHIYTSNGAFTIKLTINGNPSDPDIWKQITIYNDPIYTHAMTTPRLWRGNVHAYQIPDSSAYNIHTNLPDSTFSLTYVDEITISCNYINFTYSPSLSTGNVTVFSTSQPGGTGTLNSTISYNHITDSIRIQTYRMYQSLPGQPATEADYVWTSP